MPKKETQTGEPYRIDGRKFYWSPLDDNEVRGNLPEVQIPLRIKLKVVRGLPDGNMDTTVMFQMLEKLIPGQAEALDEMDINDFQAMFIAWQAEYNKLSGATLGE